MSTIAGKMSSGNNRGSNIGVGNRYMVVGGGQRGSNMVVGGGQRGGNMVVSGSQGRSDSVGGSKRSVVDKSWVGLRLDNMLNSTVLGNIRWTIDTIGHSGVVVGAVVAGHSVAGKSMDKGRSNSSDNWGSNSSDNWGSNMAISCERGSNMAIGCQRGRNMTICCQRGSDSVGIGNWSNNI